MISLKSSMRSLFLRLWDKKGGQMVGFRQLAGARVAESGKSQISFGQPKFAPGPHLQHRLSFIIDSA
jgi:hypothetical protein